MDQGASSSSFSLSNTHHVHTTTASAAPATDATKVLTDFGSPHAMFRKFLGVSSAVRQKTCYLCPGLTESRGRQLEMGCYGKQQPHDPRPLSPRLRQPNQQHKTEQQVRVRVTTKMKTTPKTTTSKTTTIRYSSSFNLPTVEPPLQQSNHIKRTRSNSSNQGFS